MPTELRHLLFRPAEVVAAVGDYSRRVGPAMPSGTILSCGAERSGESGVRFRIVLTRDDEDGKALIKELVFEGAVLAAALILYCHEQSIPLPINAAKSLQIFGDQVCLLTTLSPLGAGQMRFKPALSDHNDAVPNSARNPA